MTGCNPCNADAALASYGALRARWERCNFAIGYNYPVVFDRHNSMQYSKQNHVYMLYRHRQNLFLLTVSDNMSDSKDYSPSGNADYDVKTEKGLDLSPDSRHQDDNETTLGISEKKLLRKLDFRLLPALTLLYLLSFLDRSNGSILHQAPCTFTDFLSWQC